ncbi:Uncharacterised protein [BD1-7 clade bacterium]|uniref:Methyltransferase type 11 domain-containing protein n=1 Tax=BD1-7 clade bacterium TaxID=2029982 RepID=A0A5S9PF49_9GAMM|nr:Uncharacterised protein [BD1-7 clade bacterium]
MVANSAMELYSPCCQRILSPKRQCSRCLQQFYEEQGVLILLEKAKEEQVKTISLLLQQDQKLDKPERRISHYDSLPFIREGTTEQKEWRPRQDDFRAIARLLKNAPRKRILEIGPWNSWLTHHLVKWGHEVVAIDYFIDEVNGLKNSTRYREEWLSIQTDIDDLRIFSENTFDVVIFNNGLPFFRNPPQTFQRVRELTKNNGMVIALGVSYSSSFKKVNKQFQARLARFFQNNGVEMNIVNQTKGYLSHQDIGELKSLGLRLSPYREARSMLRLVASMFFPFLDIRLRLLGLAHIKKTATKTPSEL